MITDREFRVLQKYGTYMHVRFVHEAELLAKVRSLLDDLQAVIVREDHAPENGVSDLIVCYEGRFVAIELKSLGGSPTKQQLLFIERVQKAKGIGGVCDKLAEVWSLLQQAAHQNIQE